MVIKQRAVGPILVSEKFKDRTPTAIFQCLVEKGMQDGLGSRPSARSLWTHRTRLRALPPLSRLIGIVEAALAD